MYKTKQFTLIFNSLHPKTVQSPLIIFWTSGPFKYFLTRRILTSENITNKSESCRSIFCRIEVNFMKLNTLTRTQQQSASSFVNSQKILFSSDYFQVFLLHFLLSSTRLLDPFLTQLSQLFDSFQYIRIVVFMTSNYHKHMIRFQDI